jgi:hypothetical protein
MALVKILHKFDACSGTTPDFHCIGPYFLVTSLSRTSSQSNIIKHDMVTNLKESPDYIYPARFRVGCADRLSRSMDEEMNMVLLLPQRLSVSRGGLYQVTSSDLFTNNWGTYNSLTSMVMAVPTFVPYDR